jgi:hypothetical protein
MQVLVLPGTTSDSWLVHSVSRIRVFGCELFMFQERSTWKLKVVCTLSTCRLLDIAFPRPSGGSKYSECNLQGTCNELELLVRLKGYPLRGTMCACYRNVLVFSKQWLRRTYHSTRQMVLQTWNRRWTRIAVICSFTVPRSKVAVIYDYILLPCLAYCV